MITKRFHTILIVLFFTSYAYGQFSYRVLNAKQNSEDFKPLKYQSFSDSIETGYGFINPVDYSSIVFIKEKPMGVETKDWSVKKIKYVEFYDKSSSNQWNELPTKPHIIDSTELNADFSQNTSAIDTLKIYTIKKISKSLLKKDLLFQLEYENEKVRLLKIINPFYDQLFVIQRKETNVYENSTYYISANEHKLFKRTAVKNLTSCPEIVKKIEDGKYFPFKGEEVKRFADDYVVFCN